MTTQSSLPADNSHITAQERADMIESYGGMVDAEMYSRSHMRGFVHVDPILGTDTKTVRRMGSGELQSVKDADAGQEISATKRNFDRAQVTVDTIIMAREARALLNELQSDIPAQAMMAKDHGQHLARFFDAALLNMGVKTAALTVNNGVPTGIKGSQGRDLGDAFKSGEVNTLAAANDELDPDALYEAIAGTITGMEENEVDTDGLAIFVRPTQEDVLLNNDKLISREFSTDNGDFADGTIMTIKGVPIVKSTRFVSPKINTEVATHLGVDYELTAQDLKAIALIIDPSALLVGETIPLTSNIFWNDMRLAWYIQSYMAFGAAPRRSDSAGVVYTA